MHPMLNELQFPAGNNRVGVRLIQPSATTTAKEFLEEDSTEGLRRTVFLKNASDDLQLLFLSDFYLLSLFFAYDYV